MFTRLIKSLTYNLMDIIRLLEHPLSLYNTLATKIAYALATTKAAWHLGADGARAGYSGAAITDCSHERRPSDAVPKHQTFKGSR